MHLLALIAAAAFATPGQDCPELNSAGVEKALDAVDGLFTKEDLTRANTVLARTEARMPCLVDVPSPQLVARFARQRAFAVTMTVDPFAAARWAQLAEALDPGVPWPAYVPEQHPVRLLLDQEGEASSGRALGATLTWPEDGEVFLDGRWWLTASGEVGVPHLLQIADKDGSMVFSGWIDGVAFPADVLAKPGERPPPRASSCVESDVCVELTGIDPGPKVRPPVDTERRSRRLLASAGLGAAAATLYTSAWLARSAYAERPSDGLYYAVDGATAASAATGAAAATMLGIALIGR
jgi:hypothetical protein